NSFHYDVRKNPTPFEKLDFEKDYAPLTSGGFIHYCEYPKLSSNPKALEAVWDYAYDKIVIWVQIPQLIVALNVILKGNFYQRLKVLNVLNVEIRILKHVMW